MDTPLLRPPPQYITDYFCSTEGAVVRIGLKVEFVGREVEEEIERSAFEALLAGGPRRNHDLLGLAFETDGGETVLWTVGVGSGNERFLTRRADLAAALGL